MSLLQTTSSTRQSDLLGQTTCCPEEHGDSGRTRTPNLLIRSQLNFQHTDEIKFVYIHCVAFVVSLKTLPKSC